MYNVWLFVCLRVICIKSTTARVGEWERASNRVQEIGAIFSLSLKNGINTKGHVANNSSANLHICTTNWLLFGVECKENHVQVTMLVSPPTNCRKWVKFGDTSILTHELLSSTQRFGFCYSRKSWHLQILFCIFFLSFFLVTCHYATCIPKLHTMTSTTYLLFPKILFFYYCCCCCSCYCFILFFNLFAKDKYNSDMFTGYGERKYA